MDVVIHRWRVGKASLSQTWTEFVGRVMRVNEEPSDVYRWFGTWLRTGRYERT